jgi:hypothetical protein
LLEGGFAFVLYGRSSVFLFDELGLELGDCRRFYSAGGVYGLLGI